MVVIFKLETTLTIDPNNPMEDSQLPSYRKKDAIVWKTKPRLISNKTNGDPCLKSPEYGDFNSGLLTII